MNIVRITLLVLAVLGAMAQTAAAQLVLRKDSVAVQRRAELAKRRIIIDGDTVSEIIPERNLGRYDRGLYNHIYVPRGKWAFGLSANYGELKTEDLQLLSVMKDLDFQGKMYSVSPTFSYFLRHNQQIGLKVSYSRAVADLANLSVDIDDDLNFKIRDVNYINESFAMGPFYRYYVGLDESRRFAVYNEVDLMFQSGMSRFKRLYNDQPRDTRTYITQAALNFSPGFNVFLQQNMALGVSFGIFGLKLRHETQTTNGTDDGSRTTSGANFRFNIFNINFGMLLVI